MSATVPHRQLPGGLHALAWDGPGPPVLLVHGLDGSAANWLAVGPLLAAAGHRVLAPDLPGFGRSPLARHRTSLAAHADLLADLVRGELGGGPVVVAGNSMGGTVAAVLAGRHPDVVAGAVLVAAAVPRAGSSGFDASQLPALLALWAPLLGAAEAARRHRLPPDRRVAELLALCVPSGRALPPDAVAEMVDVAAARDRRDHLRGWTGAARSLWGWLARRAAFHAAVDRLDGPGVLLTGQADPIIPRSSEQAFLSRHPGWEHRPLDGVGHVPPLEDPTATADAVLAVAQRRGSST